MVITPIRKNLTSSIGPPLTFSRTCHAFGPWTWNRQSFRVTGLPMGRIGDRSSSSTSTSYPPASLWNFSQFAAGARPTNTSSSSSRWKRMPSPIALPAGVVGTYCFARSTGKVATLLIAVSEISFSASGPLTKRLTMWCVWS